MATVTGNVNLKQPGLKPENRAEKMAAYDELPEPIRWRLSTSPFDISPVDALRIYRERGLQICLMLLTQTENRIKRTSKPWEDAPEEEL